MIPRIQQAEFERMRAGTRRCRIAFTLIELILVMALLTVAVSITAPALSNFFRGRSMDSQARHILALTREGQSRAASEGIPMHLWVDSGQSVFGLEADPSYEPEDPRAVSFPLEADLQLEALSETGAAAIPTSPGRFDLLSPTSPAAGQHGGLPRIRFLPDGTVDLSSPCTLLLKNRDESVMAVALNTNRTAYEIRTP